MFGRGYFYAVIFLSLIGTGMVLAAGSGTKKKAAPSAEAAKPLQVGEMLPAVEVKTEDGETVQFAEALKGQPAAIVFYRGHWCPYCVKHLSGLPEIVGDLEEMGVNLVGVSPDKPEYIAKAKEQADLGFPIFSDGKLDLAKAMGVAFNLEPELAERYKSTLVESSGHDTGQLPVPAVFLADAEGKIQFVFSNPDYEVRLSNEDLLAAVMEMQS